MPARDWAEEARSGLGANGCAYMSGYGKARGCHIMRPGPNMLFYTGIGHPLFNGAMIGRADMDDVGAFHDRLKTEIAAQGVPAMWWISQAAQSGAMADRLASLGLAPAGEIPAMAAPLAAIPKPDGIAGLTVAEAQSDDDRRLWGLVAGRGTGFPEPACAAVSEVEPSVALTATGLQRRYLGYLDGVPVATSALVVEGGVAGVYAVATLPEARRRGIGREMTLHALAGAAGAGLRAAVLQASSMGRPIYEKLGFVRLFDFRAYMQT